MTYWLLFAAAVVVCLVGVPLLGRLERHAEARDRETWLRMPGATR